jgi:hypothetical protein
MKHLCWSGYDWNGKPVGTGCCFINSKEHRDSSLAARKVLADTTKQFKTIRQGRGSRRDRFEYQ